MAVDKGGQTGQVSWAPSQRKMTFSIKKGKKVEGAPFPNKYTNWSINWYCFCS